ncbi:hypothetical protein VU10_07580, partial [Desulfobulbus sp. US1]|nr:hypothetical protein [Desulfobulbus sp. US1]
MAANRPSYTKATSPLTITPISKPSLWLTEPVTSTSERVIISPAPGERSVRVMGAGESSMSPEEAA